MNGLPPHIAQVICGHKSIDTTIGYKAAYVSLAGAEEKLRQLDRGRRQHTAVDLGIPTMRGDR